MIINHCDICGKKIRDYNEVYSFKLYKGLMDILNTEHICFDCYVDIKKFIRNKRK